MNARSGKHLKCVVVTPERAVLDQTVDFVALPMFDGELGVLPGRVLLIGRLGCGELRLEIPDGRTIVGHGGSTGERTVRYYIDGGFAQVRADTVTVLTQKAIPAAELDVQEAERQLTAAQSAPAATAEEREARRRAEERARAQAHLARKVRGG